MIRRSLAARLSAFLQTDRSLQTPRPLRQAARPVVPHRAAEVVRLRDRRRQARTATVADALEARVLLVGEPVVITQGGLEFSEGDAPIGLFGDSTVTDSDSLQFDTGSFSLTTYGQAAGDTFATPANGSLTYSLGGNLGEGVVGSDLVSGGVVIGTLSSVTTTVQLGRTVQTTTWDLNGQSNAPRIESLLEAITFEAVGTTGDDLEPYRFLELDITLDDGDGGQTTVGDFVDVIGVDDPIVFTADAGIAADLDGQAAVLLPNVSWADPDNSDYLDAIVTVQIEQGFDASDAITLDPSSGFSIVDDELLLNGAFLGFTGTAPGFFDVYLEGDGSAAITASVVDSLLGALRFSTSDAAGTTKSLLVSYDAPDGDFAELTQTVTVVDVNDPTVIASDAATPLAFSENGPAVPLLGDVTLSDPDFAGGPGDLGGWQILARTVAGRQAGERYVVADAGDVTVSGSTVSVGGVARGTIQSSGSLLRVNLAAGTTAADGEAILEAITYQTVSNNPAVLKRGQVWLTDDTGQRTIVERQINVTTNNDAPAIANIRGSLTFFEDGGPRLLSGQAHVADVDWAGGGSLSLSWADFGAADELLLLDRGVISSSGDLANLATGDELFYNGSKLADVTVQDNGATGTITFDLVPITNRFEAREIFRAAAFGNPTDNPEPGTRTVTFTFTDELGSSASRSLPVFMRLSPDAPDLTVGNSAVVADSSAPPTALGAGFGVSDVDSPDFAGGRFTVSFASGRVGGDRLHLLDENGAITTTNATVNGQTLGSVTATATQVRVDFTAGATPADVATILNRVAFENVGAGDVSGTRTLQIALVDPSGEIDIETVDVLVDGTGVLGPAIDELMAAGF